MLLGDSNWGKHRYNGLRTSFVLSETETWLALKQRVHRELIYIQIVLFFFSHHCELYIFYKDKLKYNKSIAIVRV